MTSAALWSVLSACNDSDPVAHPAGEVAQSPNAGVAWTCDYASQLARHKLPSGLANVFVDCEWPLRPDDAPDDLSWLIGEKASAQADRHLACLLNPYRWWQEPLSPRLPQRFVYCPKACEAVKTWVRCKLRNDPCNTDDAAADGGTACK
jgi:hypothetical protein